MRLLISLLFLIMLGFSVFAQTESVSSVYTDISGEKCKTLSIKKELATSEQICPGFAGYKLIVYDSDSRMSITVVSPNAKEHPLDLWTVVSSGFSSLGNKAEWRYINRNGKQSPIALIVRYNANEDSERPEKVTSYLAVIKITSQKICVTDKIKPGPKANEEARLAADASANKPCLE